MNLFRAVLRRLGWRADELADPTPTDEERLRDALRAADRININQPDLQTIIRTGHDTWPQHDGWMKR